MNFEEKLLKDLDTMIDNCGDAILKGSYETLQDYRQAVGRLRGLREARRVVVDNFSSMNEED